MGDGKSLIDFGRDAMNVDADNWMALQAIHSAVHAAQIGQKYTWFGSGYLGTYTLSHMFTQFCLFMM